LGGQGLWLEKVRFKTKEKRDLEAITQGDDALGSLVQNLLALEIDSDNILEIDPEFDTFMNKLPAELRGGDDPFDPLSPKQWDDIRSEVKDLLIAQLLESGGAK
jgi:hypothetical protein